MGVSDARRKFTGVMLEISEEKIPNQIRTNKFWITREIQKGELQRSRH